MPSAPPKFRRRAEARPDEVLDAALDLFVEQGFAATKVEDIARRAGVSKGLVYLYFSSKDAVLEAIVRRAVAPIADVALGEIEHFDGDPRIALTGVLHMMRKALSDPKRIAVPKLILREVSQFPHIAEMYRREVLDRAVPAVTALLRRGMQNGYLRPLDPELSVRSIVGPVIAHLILAEVFHIQPDDGLAMDRFMENHLAILFDGLSAREAHQ